MGHRNFYKKAFCLLFLIFSDWVLASKPDYEASAEDCQSYLEEQADRAISTVGGAREFMPLKNFYLGQKDPFLWVTWWVADKVAGVDFSPGMFRLVDTAAMAAEEIFKEIPKAKDAARPPYNAGDIESGYKETMKLILEGKSEYIRNAVLIKKNIVTVVPLLKRISKKDSQTGLPYYVPIVIKGHQALEDWDVFSASFAAWALEAIQKKLPEEAYVYVKPMAKIRQRAQSRLEPFYRISPKTYLARMRAAQGHFDGLIQSFEDIQELEPRRNTASSESRYISYMREIMKRNKSFWMIPFPPSIEEQGALKAAGYRDTDALADLKINSTDFFSLSAKTGIVPTRLRRYVARALSKKEDRVILLDSFENPFSVKNKRRTLFHNDFEDITELGIRGGVFLVGIQVEDSNGKVVTKAHHFADKKDQYSFDEVIANLLRTLKSNRHLRKDFAITVYSHHEATKIEQVFDIVEDAPEKFKADERKSVYYSEYQSNGKTYGRLIRQTDFFKHFPDLEPSDVFTYLDRILDLLPYFRNYIVTPSHTNSLKYLSPIFSNKKINLVYPKGHNGLEVQAWVSRYWSTGNPEGKNNAIYYVQEDVDGNRLMTQTIESFANKRPDKRLQWTKKSLELLPVLEAAVKSSRRIVELHEIYTLLNRVLGKDILKLKAKQIDNLKILIDIQNYLAQRKEIRDDAYYNDSEKKSLLQQMKVLFDDSRAENLINFFENINPALLSEKNNDAQEALGEFLSLPSNYIWPSHIDMMLFAEKVKKITPKVVAKKDALDNLDIPGSWVEFYKDLKSASDETSTIKYKGVELPYVESPRLEELIKGLYYSKLFGVELSSD
ncbi:MAG: hypothetical protein KA116_03235 [Proteobacteria bacterium]|nr:hypothetical protein [Pseudomonadota bacterium]